MVKENGHYLDNYLLFATLHYSDYPEVDISVHPSANVYDEVKISPRNFGANLKLL
jgi:hypothetical protein